MGKSVSRQEKMKRVEAILNEVTKIIENILLKITNFLYDSSI
jgi:hypothetical protein